MNTKEIDEAFHSDIYARQFYRGTYPLDQIPSVLQPLSFYVMNLDTSHQSGSHWVYFWVDISEIWYVDTFARPPPLEIMPLLLKQNKTIIFSDIQLQWPLSQMCGYYVLVMGLLNARGYSITDILIKFYKAEEKNYLRNDVFSKMIISQLTSVRDRPIIDWSNFMN